MFKDFSFIYLPPTEICFRHHVTVADCREKEYIMEDEFKVVDPSKEDPATFYPFFKVHKPVVMVTRAHHSPSGIELKSLVGLTCILSA